MLRSQCDNSLHRLNGTIFSTLLPVTSGGVNSCRGICSCSRSARLAVAAAVVAAPGLERGGSVMWTGRRLLFQNQKTFPGADKRLYADDAAVAARNQSLFGGVGVRQDVVEGNVTESALPSAAELERLLPSARQLQDEIPSFRDATDEIKATGGGDAAAFFRINAHEDGNNSDDEE